jgi:hypothetical protein
MVVKKKDLGSCVNAVPDKTPSLSFIPPIGCILTRLLAQPLKQVETEESLKKQLFN